MLQRRLSSLHPRSFSGHAPEQHAVVGPALRRGLDWTISRGPFQPQLFCDSAVLLGCKKPKTVHIKGKLKGSGTRFRG